MTLSEFITELWRDYPRDLCHKRPGTRQALEKAAKKVDAKQYKKILMDMEALKRYDRQDVKPDRWPHASRFLNGRYWERVLESVVKLKEKKEPQKCKCGKPVDIAPTGECVECYAKRNDRHLQRRKNALLSILPPNQSLCRSDVIESCRALMSTKVESGESYKTAAIPYFTNLQKPSTETEKESTPSNTEVIYGEEWFKENAERVYGAIGVKFNV